MNSDIHEQLLRAIIKHLGGYIIPLRVDVKEYKQGMWDPYNLDRDKQIHEFNTKEMINNRQLMDEKITLIIRDIKDIHYEF